MKGSAFYFGSLFAALQMAYSGPSIADFQPQPRQANRESRIGIVVIDAQKNFISIAANKNMRSILENTKQVFHLAAENNVPFFITYEGSKAGKYDLPDDLKRALPPHQKDFVKTTFAATGLRSFINAISISGLTHFIVLGAETDVCVLQTVLGLRKLGFQVLLQKDAVFSSEPNTGSALRRMIATGASVVSMDKVKNLLEAKTQPASAEEGGNSIINPIVNGNSNVALVINSLDESLLASSNDRFKREKLERLRELLLMSEWMNIPTYLVGADSENFSLPRSLLEITSSKARPHLDRKQWLSFENFPTGRFEHVFVAGTQYALDHTLVALRNKGQVFLVEDAFLSAPAFISHDTAETNLVPITYKSFSFGMTQSISQAEWPSVTWVERDRVFFPIMESLGRLMPIESTD